MNRFVNIGATCSSEEVTDMTGKLLELYSIPLYALSFFDNQDFVLEVSVYVIKASQWIDKKTLLISGNRHYDINKLLFKVSDTDDARHINFYYRIREDKERMLDLFVTQDGNYVQMYAKMDFCTHPSFVITNNKIISKNDVLDDIVLIS